MEDLSGKTIKGYELQARLGAGAYGAVYRAAQPQVKREVAIKIILPEYANRPDFIRRFEAEAQLVAQLEHLHIVPLYDYWREPGGAYLVMRLMKGGSLEESLREGGPWEPADAARLVDQIASALEAAHKQGVVHRDLKPANILLDEENNAYLSDFGIAKEIGAEASATQTGGIMGTPAYITPEQVQSQPVSAQTDIYALGVVLYELLVGVHPFPDTPTGELVVKHLNEPLPYVRESNFELPAALDGVIQRATAKDPGMRYPDALSLAADLRSALDMETEAPEVPEAELTNPYKGLRAFQEADADDFFGRDALIGQLLARLVEPGEGERFLAVVGPSGSGKSSAVKAGLVPVLRKGALPGSDQWFITEMVPGAHPLEELERALMGIAVNPDLNLAEELSKESYGLLRAAWMAIPSKGSELLLVIDQFEELFILVEDEKEREHFLGLLHTAVTDKESIVRVVVTLRADFYDRPLMYPEFGQLVEARSAIVLPLTADELEQAIRTPAERVGAVQEKGLVGAISADVSEQPGALPLLQYALTELFERREGRMLTLEAYQSIGGVLGALGRRAEEVYFFLEQESKDIARQLFLRLVTLGEGAEDTRRRVLRTELEGLINHQEAGDKEQGIEDRGKGAVFNTQQSTISHAIDSFGAARLLTFDRDPVTRAPTVEVAHEALLQEWRRLREWLDESRADIRMQRVLGNAAAEWQEAERDPGFLLRGSRLDQFEAWAAGTDLALTVDEQAFMEASLAEREEREAAEAERQAREARMERRSRNFLRGLVVVLAVAAVVAVALSAFAIDRGNDAQRSALTATVAQGQAQYEAATAVVAKEQEAAQREIAQEEANLRATQQALAEEARQEALVQASIGLGSQAIQEIDSTAPERSVLLALEALEHYPYTWQAERALGRAVLENRLRMILPHDNYVTTAEWSADGSMILTGAGDGSARVWDANSGEETLKVTAGGDVYASWSPDERYILAVNEPDNVIKIFETESGAEVAQLEIDDPESAIGINPNGWEPWSPSGDRVMLTFYNDGSIRIWDAHTGEALHTLTGHEGFVCQAMWSPAGDIIVTTGCDDGIVIAWRADTGEALYSFPGGYERDSVLIASWSPSGDRFVTRGMGGAKLYDSATGHPVLELSTPGSSVFRVVWSPDGTQLLTSGLHDGTARVWDAETGEVLYRLDGLIAVIGSDWSPSGDFAAVGANDGYIHVFDPARGLEMFKFVGPPLNPNIFPLDISPDGGQIFAAGGGDNLYLYDLTRSLSLPILYGAISNVAWSPDGQQVSICVGDGTGFIKVWDSFSGEEIIVLQGLEEECTQVFWSPEGDRLMTGINDGTVKIWDAASGEELLTFATNEDQLFNAFWSPDGEQLAITHLYEDKVTLWDTATGEELLVFSEHQIGVTFAAWSPDGDRILSTADGGEAFIWETASGEVLMSIFPEDFNLEVTTGTWSQDGQRVYLQTSDGIIYSFDVASGEQLSQFPTYTGQFSVISLSPSEQRLLKGGDGNAVVWDLATGAELLMYDAGGGWVDAAYSPDGNRVLVGGQSSLQIYPTWHSTQELIDYAKECCVFRELTPDERELLGLPDR